jgi:hypothetical protein
MADTYAFALGGAVLYSFYGHREPNAEAARLAH